MTNAEVSRQRFLGLPREHLLRLLCMTTAVPAALVAVDDIIIRFVESHRSFASVAILWTALIAQTAILGLAAARLLDHAAWRWIVFGWGMILIDVLVFTTAVIDTVSSRGPRVDALMLSGQVGLLIIWGLLADIHWAWRFPAIAGAVAVSGILTLGFSNPFHFDANLPWSRTLATFLIVSVLRLFRYRLVQATADDGRLLGSRNHWISWLIDDDFRSLITSERTQDKQHQVSILHLLAWMTSVAFVLAVLRVIDWAVIQYFDASFGIHGWLHELSVATLTSIAALVGLCGLHWVKERG